MHRTKQQIAETPNGWLNRHTGKAYHSAFAALRAVKRADSRVKVGAVTVIEWVALTDCGRIAVQTISR